ncbi:MAG: hypothetical protein K6G64_08910 [Eubacterium sp.]|nr:hypothetical protein [Eubacterium sp.]
MEQKNVIIFGDLPIATKVAEWILNQEQLKLVACVVSGKSVHNNDPWNDVPLLRDFCEKKDIKVIEDMDELLQLEERLDLGLSCRFAKFINKKVLKSFSVGIVNLHGGLLPEFGGLYSCNFSILMGNGIGGGTIHWMDEKIDTGNIIRRCEFEILPEDTAYDVFQKTQVTLYDNLIELILPIANGEAVESISQKNMLEQGFVHKYFDKNSIFDYKEINANDDEETILKKVRAFDFPGYEPAFMMINGKKVYMRLSSD